MYIKFLNTINIFATDEISQSFSDFDSVCDNIIRSLWGLHIYKANKLIIGAYTPTQL